jgi:hypothetical protein
MREVLSSDDAQEIAKKSGFSGIVVPQPLAGVAYSDKQKYIIYPYMGHLVDFESGKIGRTATQRLGNLATNLYKPLSENGLRGDFGSHQFMFYPNKSHLTPYPRFSGPLYIIDAEGITFTKPKE